jgi:hypothetical protein
MLKDEASNLKLSWQLNSINFYIRTVHLDVIKVFYLPTNAQVIVLKTVLRFTLKQLRLF